VQYGVQVAVEIDRPEKSLLFIKYGGQRLLLIAGGTVTAQVDMAQIRPDMVQVRGQTVTVTLPDPAISQTLVDETRTYVYEHTRQVGAEDDKDIETEARRLAPAEMSRWAAENGILEQSRRYTRAFVEAYLRRLGFASVTVN
jgi:hypothetical protein